MFKKNTVNIIHLCVKSQTWFFKGQSGLVPRTERQRGCTDCIQQWLYPDEFPDDDGTNAYAFLCVKIAHEIHKF